MRSLVIVTLCLAAATAVQGSATKDPLDFVQDYLFKMHEDGLYKLLLDWEDPEEKAKFLGLFSPKVAKYFEAYLGTPQFNEAGIAKMVGWHNSMRFHANRELKDLVWNEKYVARAHAVAMKTCIGSYDPEDLCNKYNTHNITEHVSANDDQGRILNLGYLAYLNWEYYSENMEKNSNPNYCPMIRERMLSTETESFACGVAECDNYSKGDYHAVLICDYF